MDENYDEFGNYVDPESDFDSDKEEQDDELHEDEPAPGDYVGPDSESDFDSDEEEQDDEPHDDEPAPGDEPLESVVAYEEEIITPDRKLPFEVGVDSSSLTHVDPKFLVDLMGNPDLVRNLALVGHLHHGKTILMDMLVEQTHHMSTFDTESEKHMRFTDTRIDEQEREMSFKAVPMSLVLQDSEQKSYLCNIMDTPGHVDFSDEMTAALRLADGAVLVVDAAEGVRLNTERAIRHAIQEGLPIVVVISKVDRLITELRLSLEDVYNKLKDTIEVINNHISAVPSTAGERTVIDPTAGNVCFASGKDGWSFTLQSYAKRVINGYDDTSDPNDGAACLWGDKYYCRKSNTFRNQPIGDGGERSFVAFILEPLRQLYGQVIERDKKDVETRLGVELSRDAYTLKAKSYRRFAGFKIDKSNTGFIDMLVRNIPSAKEATGMKLEHAHSSGLPVSEYEKVSRSLTPSVHLRMFKAMVECDSAGPLMINIIKLYPKSDCSGFDAFGRVYSGTIRTGQSVKVYAEGYSPENQDVEPQKVTKLWVFQGRYRLPISMALPGSWVLVEGVDASIMKTATLCNADCHDEAVRIFRPLKFNTLPVVKIAIEPLNPSELPQMLEDLSKISKSYPLAITQIEKPESRMIVGTGELYLDFIKKDLRELYSEVELKVAYPVVSLCETAMSASTMCSAESTNGRNRIKMVAGCMEEAIAKDIENGLLDLDNTPEFFRRYGWIERDMFYDMKRDIDMVNSNPVIGFFLASGHDDQVPHILLDRTQGIDRRAFHAVEDSIVEGFRQSAQRGPLCDERMRNVIFAISGATIAPELEHRQPEQIIPMASSATHSSFLLTDPRLMEPVYRVEIKTTDEESASHVYEILSRRRGSLTAPAAQIGSLDYIIKATIPVIESFGLDTELRQLTQGQASCLCVFDHWHLVPGDPMDRTVVLTTGQPVPREHLARDFMIKTRLRKGMNEDVDMNQFLGEQ